MSRRSLGLQCAVELGRSLVQCFFWCARMCACVCVCVCVCVCMYCIYLCDLGFLQPRLGLCRFSALCCRLLSTVIDFKRTGLYLLIDILYNTIWYDLLIWYDDILIHISYVIYHILYTDCTDRYTVDCILDWLDYIDYTLEQGSWGFQSQFILQ